MNTTETTRRENCLQLYSNMPGWKRAHAAILRKLDKTLAWVRSTPRSKGRELVWQEAMQRMDPILHKYVDFGALDTEPVGYCSWAIRKVLDGDESHLLAEVGTELKNLAKERKP